MCRIGARSYNAGGTTRFWCHDPTGQWRYIVNPLRLNINQSINQSIKHQSSKRASNFRFNTRCMYTAHEKRRDSFIRIWDLHLYEVPCCNRRDRSVHESIFILKLVNNLVPLKLTDAYIYTWSLDNSSMLPSYHRCAKRAARDIGMDGHIHTVTAIGT